jgi:hypothetical protein
LTNNIGLHEYVVVKSLLECYNWFAEHSSLENSSPDNFSPEDSSPEDSSLVKNFPGGGSFFARVFFAGIILRWIILRKDISSLGKFFTG